MNVIYTRFHNGVTVRLILLQLTFEPDRIDDVNSPVKFREHAILPNTRSINKILQNSMTHRILQDSETAVMRL